MVITTELLRKFTNDSSDINNLILAAKAMTSNIGIEGEADFKKHHRRRLAPKRLDSTNTNQAELDIFTFYRKEFRTVMDTLLSRLSSSIADITKTLIFLIFP